MVLIPRQRAILNRATLDAALEEIVLAARAPSSCRAELLAVLKEAHARGDEEIHRRFEADPASGPVTVRSRCFLIDQLIRVIYDLAAIRVYPVANPTSAEHQCLSAVGGYGRGELAPHSDIDLLFVVPYKRTPRVEQVVEYVLYMLWDLGLKVGHATRSIEDCIRLSKADQTICTAILESRYIWGEKKLYTELRKRFRKQVVTGSEAQFVEAKLAERDQRHLRMGDSRYVLEPNIKDGKGGMRDLQTMFWIAKYLYRVDNSTGLVQHSVLTQTEAARFDKAQRFFWNVRCNLHYLTGRGEDRLTFDHQGEIGARLGYRDHAATRGVERFMKHYYLTAKGVGDLTRIFCAALEAEHTKRPRFALPRLGRPQHVGDRLTIESGRLALAKPNRFADNPVDILRLFHTAQENEIEVHPRPLRSVTRNLRLVDGLREDAEANRLFLEMLTSGKDPETTLRRLNEAGVFGRFIPEFGRVVAQMQHDMYHVYTVDEHTIMAIGILRGIEAGHYAEEVPIATEVVKLAHSRRALYMAVLLHDIAKGRGGDHSVIGEQIARRLCPRIGLTEEETETTAWLVRQHLLMSNTAFRRDVSDPQTITDFVGTVRSLERLRLLLVLTVADIRAVGPGVWTAWKAALLRDLYRAGEQTLNGGFAATGAEHRIESAKDAARAALADLPAEDVEDHLAKGYPSYWLSFTTDAHVRHARLIRRAEIDRAPLLMEKRVDTYRGVTELTLYAADQPGLFSLIAGALAICGANIVDAKIVTMTDGMALDTFWVEDQNGGPVTGSDRLERISATIERTLAGYGEIQDEIHWLVRNERWDREQVFDVAPRVIIDNSASQTHTVVEVNGRDRPGLLWALTQALTGQEVQIASAQIATYGENAVDVFYIKDVFGLKIAHEAKLERIRAALLDALSSFAALSLAIEPQAAEHAS